MVDLPVLEVAAGIILSENKFLATQRPAGKPLAGYWEFPGGKIRDGESPFEALRRELEEELGIMAEKGDFLFCREHTYPGEGFKVRLHFFVIRKWSNEPCAREGQKMAWLTPEAATGLDFLPADREIVARADLFLPD